MIEMRKSNDMLESHMIRFAVRTWNHENLIGWPVIENRQTYWSKTVKKFQVSEKNWDDWDDEDYSVFFRGAEMIVQEEGKGIMRINGSS